MNFASRLAVRRLPVPRPTHSLTGARAVAPAQRPLLGCRLSARRAIMIYPPSCSPQGLDKTSTAGTNTSEVPASANTYAKLERDLANERLHSARNLHEAGRSGYPEPLPNLGATNQWERVPATYGLSSIRARAREGISSARAKLSGGGGHGGARSPDRQLANYQRRHGVSELLRRTDLTPVGRLTELQSLLAAGVDVNQTVKVGWQAFRTSLLFEACVNGELMLVRTLLEHGADATRPYGPSGLTCLYNGMRARAQPCTVTLRVRVRSRLCVLVCVPSSVCSCVCPVCPPLTAPPSFDSRAHLQWLSTATLPWLGSWSSIAMLAPPRALAQAPHGPRPLQPPRPPMAWRHCTQLAREGTTAWSMCY